MSRECSLLDLPQGVKGRVRSFHCDTAERSHLLALGFTPGVEVEMCQGDTDGCRVHVRDSSIVLQGGIARRIVCDTMEGDDGEWCHQHPYDHYRHRHEYGRHDRCSHCFRSPCGLDGGDAGSDMDACRYGTKKDGTNE